MPSDDNDILYFKDIHKQLKVPLNFVIYADFESILIPCTQENLNDDVSYTQKTHKHQASGFCYIVVSDVGDFNTPPVNYRGENAVEKFLECLLVEEKRIRPILEHVVPMELSALDERSFHTATYCHICDEELGTDRVRDHCHLTGKYTGAAHSGCNLNYKFTKRIPVVFHNLKNYEAHLLIKAMGMIKDKAISCIPTNDEKYISFSIGDLIFIDSLQFLNASLEKLVSNLAKEGVGKFKVLNRYIDEEKVPLLLRKGIYPYEHFDSFNSDFPLCPEKLKVTDDMLSSYCQQLKEDLGLKEPSIGKLIPNLHNKTRYILQYKNLKLYLDLGMKLTKIHRVLTFQQSPWLKEYIDFKTEKRKQAANDFEKDFFKLLTTPVGNTTFISRSIYTLNIF